MVRIEQYSNRIWRVCCLLTCLIFSIARALRYTRCCRQLHKGLWFCARSECGQMPGKREQNKKRTIKGMIRCTQYEYKVQCEPDHNIYWQRREHQIEAAKRAGHSSSPALDRQLSAPEHRNRKTLVLSTATRDGASLRTAGLATRVVFIAAAHNFSQTVIAPGEEVCGVTHHGQFVHLRPGAGLFGMSFYRLS
jgi:hypothetical protein